MTMVRIRRHDGMFLEHFDSASGVPRVGDLVRLSKDETLKVDKVVWVLEGSSVYAGTEIHVWLGKK